MTAPQDASWPRRLISPSGLALVLVCLFLPFVGVSCESGLGTLDIRVSGWDMAVNGAPSVTGTGILGAENSGAADLSDQVAAERGQERVGVQPLMLAGVLMILTSLVISVVLPTAFARALGGLTATALATLLIAGNEVVVLAELRDEIDSAADGLVSDAVAGTRFGFWVTLALLIAIMGYTTVEAELSRQRRSTMPPSPPSMPSMPPYPSGPWPPGPQQPQGNGVAHPGGQSPGTPGGPPLLGERSGPYGPPPKGSSGPYGPPYGGQGGPYGPPYR